MCIRDRYTFDTGRNQAAVAHISVAVTLILLLIVIAHHVHTYTSVIPISKIKELCHSLKKKRESCPSNTMDRKDTVSSFSVVEIPKPQSSMTNSKNTQGLAEIALYTCSAAETNTTLSEVTETRSRRSDMHTSSTQADFILDELTIN